MSTRSPVSAPPRFWSAALALFFAFTLVLAPSLAEARAGKSFSSGGSSSGASGMGSRGSRTFERNDAAPITRSVNPNATTAARPSGVGPAAVAGAAGAAAPSFFQRHPILTGLAGGFLGAALFSHLGMGAGMGTMFGGLLTMLLIGGLIFLAIRFFASRRAGFTGGGAGSGGPLPASVGAAAAPSASRYRGRDTTVDDADLNAFQAIHGAVQEAWGHGDLGRLRQVMTPEMLGYFSEELTRNTSEGVQNVVSDVRLLKGDITESWDEGDLKYATAYMQWSAVDYVVRLGRSPGMPDYIVSGDPKQPTESEEVWTFVRQRNGNWLLSAVQQV